MSSKTIDFSLIYTFFSGLHKKAAVLTPPLAMIYFALTPGTSVAL